jgi:hypothetical protein
LARVTYRIQSSLYAAERIMDFQHMGVTLTPDQAILMGAKEIDSFHNAESRTQEEAFRKTTENILQRKINQVGTLVKSYDNLISSVAGSFGVVYDALGYQLRQSGHEAKRQMYQSITDYNENLQMELKAVDAEVTEKNFSGKVARWSRVKSKVNGIDFNNEELLTLYIHNSSTE